MEIGIGVQITWSLAAQEAAAGGAEKIEPGHFLCGALKLAEVPGAFLKEAVPDTAVFAVLEQDQRALREVLESRSIKVPAGSTSLRRELRGVLRKAVPAERAANRPAVSHRSAASRTLLAHAALAAQQTGENEVSATRLLETLLENPDEALAGVLDHFAVDRVQDRAAAPGERAWIDTYGCDLTARARLEKPDSVRLETIRRDAVCRVLAETLFGGSGASAPAALLVSEGERSASAVVDDVAFWVISSSPPAGTRRACVLEISSSAIVGREAQGSPETRLQEVFRLASTSRGTVLFFDDFHRYLTPSIAGEALARRFKAVLNDGKTSCILGMTQEQYQTHVERAAALRRALRLICIHNAHPDFQL